MLSALMLACCLATDAPARTPLAEARPPMAARDSVRAHSRARNAVRTYVRRATPSSARSLRPDLVEQLDGYARLVPGDDWIAGHRIGMRIKQGWYSSAAAEALRCQASAWWCSMLAGTALHAEGSQAEAERAFDRGLAAMPRQLRCEWAEELAVILEGELRARYLAADCDGRIALEPRIWWLSDPLWILPGNDRRSEHYARMVTMQLHHELLAVAGRQPCAHEHHFAILRHGWPEWWWGPGPLDSGTDGARFIPAAEAVLEPFHARADAWSLAAGPAESYAPSWGPLRDVDQQTSFFARGDSLEAVTAALFGRTRTAGVAFARSETEPPTVAAAPDGAGLVVRARLPRDAWLVSVEAVRDPAGAARHRFAHRLPEAAADGLALSDLLVFNWGVGLAEDLEAVAPRALPGTRFAANRSVGIYWEVYGAAGDEPVEVSLSVHPEDPGLLPRLAQTLRLRTERQGAAVRWQGTGGDGGILPSHLRLDLSPLTPGRYTLQLEVRQGDGPAAVSRRVIEIT